jgi:hypothetical protein
VVKARRENRCYGFFPLSGSLLAARSHSIGLMARNRTISMSKKGIQDGAKRHDTSEPEKKAWKLVLGKWDKN